MGFSTVIILVDSIVDSIIGDFDEKKYNYSIYGYNLDTSNLPLLKSSDKKPSKDSIKFDISIPNGNWTLYLENKENRNLNLNFFRLLVLALAFFVAYAVYKYLSLLYEERNRFKKLIKNSSDGVHVIDKYGNMYETSQTFADMLGYSYEETLKLNVRDWNISNEALDKNYVLNRIKNNKSYETIHKRKDGTTYIAEVILKQIDLNGKDYYQASVRDITEFIEQEKQIKELNEQLDEQVKIRTNELNHSLQIVEKNVISSKTDLDGIIIEVTDKFCEISKYSREEL